MRLFVAIDLDPSIRERISRFVEGVQNFAPQARWTNPESWHITLKFIGEFPDAKIAELKAALATVQAPASTISFRGTGVFPTPKAARVFWVGIEADEHLSSLAGRIDEVTKKFGVESEKRAFTPHLTLARIGSGRPSRGPEDRKNQPFAKLLEQVAKMPPPDFGTMTARELWLYQSKLSPKGAQYTKLERFPLQ